MAVGGERKAHGGPDENEIERETLWLRLAWISILKPEIERLKWIVQSKRESSFSVKWRR